MRSTDVHKNGFMMFVGSSLFHMLCTCRLWSVIAKYSLTSEVNQLSVFYSVLLFSVLCKDQQRAVYTNRFTWINHHINALTGYWSLLFICFIKHFCHVGEPRTLNANNLLIEWYQSLPKMTIVHFALTFHYSYHFCTFITPPQSWHHEHSCNKRCRFCWWLRTS